MREARRVVDGHPVTPPLMQRHKGVQPSTLTLTLTSGSVINVGKMMHLTKAHLEATLVRRVARSSTGDVPH